MTRQANPTDGGALVLSIAAFTKGGLPEGILWTAPTIPIDADGRTLGLDITIDTRDPDRPVLLLEHEGRGAETGPRTLYAVELERTAQPFGGVRWWFRCPVSGRRATKLFLPRGGNAFACRRAWGLAYGCQRETDGDLLQRRGDRLWRDLRGSGPWCFARAGDLPPKPKWMRWPTYDRMALRLSRLSRELLAQTMADFARLKDDTRRRRAT
jgi:hypothetical protein